MGIFNCHENLKTWELAYRFSWAKKASVLFISWMGQLVVSRQMASLGKESATNEAEWHRVLQQLKIHAQKWNENELLNFNHVFLQWWFSNKKIIDLVDKKSCFNRKSSKIVAYSLQVLYRALLGENLTKWSPASCFSSSFSGQFATGQLYFVACGIRQNPDRPSKSINMGFGWLKNKGKVKALCLSSAK